MRWNYYKLRQLSLLQRRWTVVTNCDSLFITKYDTFYYKLRQVLQSAMDFYKLRQVLQSEMIITNCDSTNASSHHENVAFADRRFISKNELHARLSSVKIWKIVQVPMAILMTNYIQRQRDLNEEFVSFSCELHLHLSRSQ